VEDRGTHFVLLWIAFKAAYARDIEDGVRPRPARHDPRPQHRAGPPRRPAQLMGARRGDVGQQGRLRPDSLLAIMTFTIVANLKHVKERHSVPD